MIIGRGYATHSSAGSRPMRRASAVAPAMQNPKLSWADRCRLSLTLFRIARPRKCDAFEAGEYIGAQSTGQSCPGICASKQTERVFTVATEDAPALRIFVDGAHIRCWPEYQTRNLDIVFGKIESHDRCCRFALVQQAILSPASQLRQDLRELGWDHKQTVTGMSDGEPALPNLVRNAVGGNVRHILDSWHISIRIQHVENAVKGLLQSRASPAFQCRSNVRPKRCDGTFGMEKF